MQWNTCVVLKEETEQALSWKQDSILGQTVDFELYVPVSVEMTYQLENQAPSRKSPRALHRLKEYPNYLCNRTGSFYYAYWGMITGLLITVQLFTT